MTLLRTAPTNDPTMIEVRPLNFGGSIVLTDEGGTTAEYAITTLAACGFAALLVVILKSGAVKGILSGLITGALKLGS